MESILSSTHSRFNIAEDSSKDVDKILASALSQMTMQEREQVYEEIHGVDQVQEETPEFIQKELAAMNDHLAGIAYKPAYDLAQQLNPTYVEDEKFRLMFLRAEYYDSRKAAARLAMFMEKKLEFFGKDVLARDIYLSDLDRDDMQALRSGYFQVLPNKDRSGRVVFVDAQKTNREGYKQPINVVSAAFHCVDTDPTSCPKVLISVLDSLLVESLSLHFDGGRPG